MPACAPGSEIEKSRGGKEGRAEGGGGGGGHIHGHVLVAIKLFPGADLCRS
jgi:hypothetical protein